MTYTLQHQPDVQIAEEPVAPEAPPAEDHGHSLDTSPDAEPLRATGDTSVYRVPPLSIVMLVSLPSRQPIGLHWRSTHSAD